MYQLQLGMGFQEWNRCFFALGPCVVEAPRGLHQCNRKCYTPADILYIQKFDPG